MNQWSYPVVLILAVLSLYGCAQTTDSGSTDPPAPTSNEQPTTDTSDDAASTTSNNHPISVSPQPPFPDSKVNLPPVESLEVKGDMTVAGSSTVFPLTKTMYQMFVEDGYAGVIRIDALGTEEGFNLFCREGRSDIVNASRAIKPEETAACTAIGRQPVSFRVGTDALVVVVNAQNNFINQIDLENLSILFSAEKWSDVNPNYPEEPITRFVPSLDSGTLDFFVQTVYGGELEPLLQAPNTQLSNTSEALLNGVNQNPYSVAILNYAFYHKNANTLKALSINGIEANSTTVEKSQYPLARPLFIYSDIQILKSKPQVAAFINFYLNNVYQGIAQVGYFPNNSDVLDQEKTKFLKAIN
ncbi:substrate-binding domain-containing protein [Leptolyngbya cf. ectocarpi LEGE 11479]|uniref:Substrate-binding domain-containing protein n=1 Tax=Leptolyngbya cf. ectocarpi LEGE 11479 TaxID=1828722 RepID=A0A928ZS56_LEPEC|nr:substrate-binding domain-containing protein [Leptolyngbya ectocarpi]MBE9065652.1 substrate-binding domain-containing protein [Leptolyngbya cf. ectocarpi LEGE 11479]